ncbi:MAG: hypothetical protein FWH39_01815 [Bacteroidales bacterium]|nr:hypothetical protein [Bacteroidales bacterium]
MRRIAAQYLFIGQGPMLRRGVVTLDDTGQVMEVGQLPDTEICSTEFYNGIIIPEVGVIAPDLKPVLLLIEGVDFTNMKLLPTATATVLTV